MTNPNLPGRLSRRRFLGLSGIVGAGAVLGGSSLLAACGGDDDGGTSSETTAGGGGGGGGGKLFFENWPAYIDPETVDLFRQQTGIDLTYTEAYSDNNEYFAKVQPQLSRGQRIDADLVAPTNWMAARYIQLGWAQKLPLDKVANAANLRDDLVKPATDPTGEYTLPWQTGITGIAYNLSATGRDLSSVNDLFDPAFKGKIGMLTEMRDTVGLALLSEGIDPSTTTTFDVAAPAFDKLNQAKSDGQIRAFTGNDYLDDLNVGNFAACVAWSGDVLQLSKDNPDVKFIVPDEGGMSWFDTMLWVTGSEASADDVAAWMNFVYDPVNAARITAYVQYVSPVKGVQEELAKMGGEAAALAEDPLLFPDAEKLARLKVFALLDEEEEAKFDQAFAELTGA
jgi:spermidine/putrescine transport system substrate-binding protein